MIAMSAVTAGSFAGRAARYGLWGLPLNGVLLGLSVITHEPSRDDFDAYARYVTTDVFVASHLGASILGAAAAVIGVVAVTAFLVTGRAARLAVVGLALTAVSQVFMAAAFGGAVFVQPGIGRAHLSGVEGMPALNRDTAYGVARFATALGATFALIVSAVVVGIAIARTSPQLHALGTAFAVLLPVFAISGFAFQPLQPYAGFAFAAATALLAVRLPQVTQQAAEYQPTNDAVSTPTA
jgi:hypothetical protein